MLGAQPEHRYLMPTPPLSALVCRRLEKVARASAKNSYSPYSQFPVGAALLAASGRIYPGTNVENASYSLCNCAERTALFTAIAQGEREIRAIVIYTPTPQAASPCGACRQVLNEFGPQALVISICQSRDRIEAPLDQWLPLAFGPKNLAGKASRTRR